MHEFTSELEILAGKALAYSLERLKDDPPLDGPRSAQDLFAEVGQTITAQGAPIVSAWLAYSYLINTSRAMLPQLRANRA